MGVPQLSPGEAVDAFEEAIVLVKQLSGGGPPVTFEGKHYRVREIDPAPVAAPLFWTGSGGPKSLAATGRVADGWLPPMTADWRSERYRTGRPIIDEAAASVGRDPREIRTIYNLPGRITDRPLATTRDGDGRWIGGSVAQWVEELTGGLGAHSVIEAVGTQESTMQAIGATRGGGHVGYVGVNYDVKIPRAGRPRGSSTRAGNQQTPESKVRRASRRPSFPLAALPKGPSTTRYEDLQVAAAV